MVDLVWFQLLSAALFVIGLYGVLARRSAVLIIMSIELMLNAVNINLIAAASHLEGYGAFERFDGQLIAIFIITVAAAEVGLALAIILRIYRKPFHGQCGRNRPDEMVNTARSTVHFAAANSLIGQSPVGEVLP